MWRARDAQVPMGHMGDAWDVANAALFLASDESKYVTGIELVVDGGITLKSSVNYCASAVHAAVANGRCRAAIACHDRTALCQIASMRGCLDILRPCRRVRCCARRSPHAALATGTEPATDPQIDPAPCVAAAAANDDDKIIAICGALIDNEKTAKADRIKALIARAGAYDRKDMIDRAIGDYDTVLRLDPTLADIFNARGELWRKKGDRPRALADFGAAIKLNPDHAAARANYKSLAQELERLGALMAVAASRASIAPPPGARWRRRSAPIPSSPISTARSMR